MAQEFFIQNWIGGEREVRVNRLNKVLTERVLEVLKNGHFVEARAYYSYSIHLYSYKNQFVEILVDDYTDNVLWISDAQDRDIEKYVSNVDLNQLFN